MFFSAVQLVRKFQRIQRNNICIFIRVGLVIELRIARNFLL